MLSRDVDAKGRERATTRVRQVINLPLNRRECDALRAYVAACDEARGAYRAACDKALRVYADTSAAARRAHSRAQGAAWRAYSEARDEARGVHCKMREEASRARSGAFREALKAYAANPAANPLALWIEGRAGNPFERDEILSLLADGADFAELEKYATESRWCRDWDEAVVAALECFDINSER
jgi:hypothetical protein